ncbi:MAG: ABC transporter permease [Rhodanobacteraceae bacterium]
MNVWRLAVRNLRREWRLPELRALIAALALAVVALGTVATLSARAELGVVASAAQLIGGDAGVSAPARVPDRLTQHARQLGLATSLTARFPTVAFAGKHSQMLDVMAADTAWPLRGELVVADAAGNPRDRHAPQAGAVYLDHRAMVGLGATVGGHIQIGGRELRVAGQIIGQPDGGSLIVLAPRALMHLGDARAMGLLGRGSRANHQLLVAGAPREVDAWLAFAKAHKPDNGELITPAKVQARMRTAFARAGAFLRLASLLAALLAGIAIALAARQYARRKTDEVALLRALGMPRRQIGALLGVAVALVALPAVVAGALLALGLSQLAWLAAGHLLGTVPTALPLAPVAGAALMGLAVLAGFALPPLVRLSRLPPVAVFRREWERPSWRDQLWYVLPVAVALGLIWLQSPSLGMAGILAASLTGVGMLAMALSAAAVWLLNRLARRAHPSLRLGLASLARRRGLSALQATALALGLTALLLLGVVAPALLDGWRRELPPDTPNWFVLNLQTDQRAGFEKILARLGANQLNMLPLAVGKLTSINGRAIDAIDFADPDTRQDADRQLRMSWSSALPPSNQIVAGRWQGADPRRAEVSIDELWRDRFHLKLGDTLGFEVGGVNLATRVTSIRKVDWGSFRVNFFLLLDPAHAARLPHTWLASFYLPHAQSDQLAALTNTYPNLSLIDVDSLLERIRGIIDQVASATRWVLGFSLLAGALVLAAALSATQRERRHEAALLRTLGAHRAQLRLAAAFEFGLLGSIAALTAAFGAIGAGAWLARSVFHIRHFVPPLLPIAASMVASTTIVMLLGLAATRRIVHTSPLALLRRG